MAYRLPPLNALRAFEAAGRHLSFTKAAEELHVTQAAISHQIKALESWLEVRLFQRLNRALLLTEPGQRYLISVRAALEQLEGATRQVMESRPDNLLSLSVIPSFGAKWLVSRLARFAHRHPEIELRFTAEDRNVDFSREDVDMGIRYGRGSWPGLHATRLMRQEVFPVCSPQLVESGPHPLRQPADLRHHTLLHEDVEDFDWGMWLRAAGIDGVDAAHGPNFSHAHVSYQAAIVGQGVALGATPLVNDDLAAGRLVAPFDFVLAVDWAYYVVCDEARADEPKIAAFREWLLEEAVQIPLAARRSRQQTDGGATA
jgi:LysR family glycine cleavage system transcriptional activator